MPRIHVQMLGGGRREIQLDSGAVKVSSLGLEAGVHIHTYWPEARPFHPPDFKLVNPLHLLRANTLSPNM